MLHTKKTSIIGTLELTLYTIMFFSFVCLQISPLPEPNSGVSLLIAGCSILVPITLLTLSAVFNTAISAKRTPFISFLILLILSKFVNIINPAEPLTTLGFISLFSFLITLTVFSAQGILYLMLVSQALFWSAPILNIIIHREHIETSEFSFYALLILGFNCCIFLTSFFRNKVLKQQLKQQMQEELIKIRRATSKEADYGNDEHAVEKTNDHRRFFIEHTVEQIAQSGKELESIVFFMNQLFRPNSVLAFVYEEKQKTFILGIAKTRGTTPILTSVSIPAGKGLIGEVANSQQTFTSGNMTLYNQDLGYYNGNEIISSIFIMPIFSQEKDLLGVLVIDSKEKNAYRDTHREILSRFAHLASALLINIRMRKVHEQNSLYFQMFYESMQTFIGTTQSKDVLDNILTYIRSIGDFSRVTALACETSSRQCNIITVNSDTAEIIPGYSFEGSPDSLVIGACTNNRIQYVSDFQAIRSTTPLFIKGENLNLQIRSVLVIPFANHGIKHQVCIVIETNHVDSIPKNLRHILTILINNGALAYEKAVLYQQMQELATTDGLTLLCNHRTFQEHLHELIIHSHRYKRALSLLLMDIDHFKSFNDTYGHQIGDLVLKSIAKSLQASVRSSDLVARYGGEEFVIILPETDIEHARTMSERIRLTIEKTPIHTDRGDLSVTISVGCATLDLPATTQEQLINCADTAMYTSKENGRNRTTVFSADMKNI